MKYLKKFENDIENQDEDTLYPILYDFLMKIRPEQRYMVRNHYAEGLKSGKGLAFVFGSKFLFSIKTSGNMISSEVEMNCCSVYAKNRFTDVYVVSKNITDFFIEVFKKHSFSESKTTCFFYFKITNDNIQSIKNDLTKENFEVFVDAKKYNL